MEFTELFKPINIGNLEIKNRIGGACTTTGGADINGYITENAISTYAARAAGGAGFVCIECTFASVSRRIEADRESDSRSSADSSPSTIRSTPIRETTAGTLRHTSSTPYSPVRSVDIVRTVSWFRRTAPTIRTRANPIAKYVAPL